MKKELEPFNMKHPVQKVSQIQCNICSKSFLTKTSLKHHIQRLHPNENLPYSCEVCGKQYQWNSVLKIHRYTHDVNKTTYTGNIFKCETCDKQFRWKSHLNNHKIIHTRNTRDTCSKSFQNKENLTCHQRRHKGIKESYNCDKCAKSFSVKRNLIRHLIVHSGEKSYFCQKCPKSFGRKDQLIGIRTKAYFMLLYIQPGRLIHSQ